MIVSHGGDLGDLLAQLNYISLLCSNSVDLVLHNTSNMVREPFTFQKVSRLETLFLQQPYIKSVRYSDNVEGLDLNIWRKKASWKRGENLSDMFGKVFDLPKWDTNKPWIFAEKRQVARVVIHRSPRYQANRFPWRDIVTRYGKDAVFVGSREEYLAFTSSFGDVAYYETPTLKDLAETIAGSSLFVGNQSAPFWLATALGNRIWLEVSNYHDNCRYPRANIIFNRDMRIIPV